MQGEIYDMLPTQIAKTLLRWFQAESTQKWNAFGMWVKSIAIDSPSVQKKDSFMSAEIWNCLYKQSLSRNVYSIQD